ncbi:MAG: WG repeat-containing protein [Vicingaceae bacterium]|nr:WG repeat-containing protein [Vicingaceae bacterium]
MTFISIRHIWLFLLLLSPVLSFSQFGKFKTTQDSKNRYKLIDTKTNKVFFSKCVNITPILGDFENTNQQYNRFILLKKGKKTTVFDGIKGEIVASIECDSLTFSEVDDSRFDVTIKSETKKNVIQGTVRNKRKELNFLLNVATTEIKGYYSPLINIYYNKNRDLLIYKISSLGILMDENFKPIYSLEYLIEYDDGYFSGKGLKENLYGVIDAKGKVKIPFIYQNLNRFNNTFFSALDNYNRVGIINSDNQIIIPFEYDCFDKGYIRCNQMCKPITDSIFMLKKNDKTIVIDANNQIIIPSDTYKDISVISEYFLKIKSKNNLLGVFDLKKQREIFPCVYENIEMLDDYLIAHKNTRMGVLNLYSAEIQVSFNYKSSYKYFQKNDTIYFILEREGRKGVITIDGVEKIPFIFDDISYENPFLLIKQRGLYGVVSTTTFKEILPCKYSKIDAHNLRVEKIEETGIKKGIFNDKGVILWDN